MDQLKQKRIRTAQVIARIVQSAFSLPYRQLMVPSIDAASCVAGISPAPAPSACRIVIALEYSTIFLLGAAILSGRASWRHSTPLRQRSAGATAAGARRQALVQAGRQCLSQERQGQPPGPPHCCQAHFLASWLHEWRRCARWSTLVAEYLASARLRVSARLVTLKKRARTAGVQSTSSRFPKPERRISLFRRASTALAFVHLTTMMLGVP